MTFETITERTIQITQKLEETQNTYKKARTQKWKLSENSGYDRS